jgi:hypothetical protein
MQIFNYDPITRALIGAGIADENPLEPGEFIIPAYATAVAPPNVPAGKYAAFDSAWQLLDAVGPVAEVIAETQEQTIARYTAALDAHINATAAMYGWDNRITFALRAAFPNRWQAQAIAFGVWMDECNAQGYDLLDAVIAGDVPQPTVAEYIAGLPAFVLPAL